MSKIIANRANSLNMDIIYIERVHTPHTLIRMIYFIDHNICSARVCRLVLYFVEISLFFSVPLYLIRYGMIYIYIPYRALNSVTLFDMIIIILFVSHSVCDDLHNRHEKKKQLRREKNNCYDCSACILFLKMPNSSLTNKIVHISTCL